MQSGWNQKSNRGIDANKDPSCTPPATGLHPSCGPVFSFPEFFSNLCPSPLFRPFFSFLAPWPQILQNPLFSAFFALHRLFSAFRISLVRLRIGTAQTYVGSVGVHSAVFVLTWQPDGNVVGHYYHPDNSGVIFKLKGKNTGHGELVLTEYAADVQSAIITLKKSTSRGLIVWSGKMHNTDKHDSRVLDVSFTRKADA